MRVPTRTRTPLMCHSCLRLRSVSPRGHRACYNVVEPNDAQSTSPLTGQARATPHEGTRCRPPGVFRRRTDDARLAQDGHRHHGLRLRRRAVRALPAAGPDSQGGVQVGHGISPYLGTALVAIGVVATAGGQCSTSAIAGPCPAPTSPRPRASDSCSAQLGPGADRIGSRNSARGIAATTGRPRTTQTITVSQATTWRPASVAADRGGRKRLEQALQTAEGGDLARGIRGAHPRTTRPGNGQAQARCWSKGAAPAAIPMLRSASVRVVRTTTITGIAAGMSSRSA